MLKPALEFLHRIQARYPNQPEVYNKFLTMCAEIVNPNALQGNPGISTMEHWSVTCLSAKCIQNLESAHRAVDLLKEHTDLMREFVQFLPDGKTRKDTLAHIADIEKSRKAGTSGRAKRVGKTRASGSTAAPPK